MKSLSAGTIRLHDKVPYAQVTVQNELETCLGCLACDTSCPADIRYSEMLEGLKKTLFDTDPKYRRQLDQFLKDMPVDNPRKMRALTLLLAVAKASGAIGLAQHTPLKYLLPARKRTMVKLLAKRIPLRSSSQQLSREMSSAGRESAGEKKLRVGVFLGCVNDNLFAEVNMAMVRVLRRLGADVVVPKSESCCGAIHDHMGGRQESEAMAIRNCDRFVGLNVDVIAVSAAGCGHFMKRYTHAFADHPALREIGPKFRDVHEVVWQLLEGNPSLKNQWVWPERGKKVTYHEACHLVHAQGVSDIPRTLLQSIQGLEYVALNEASMCCGSAGTYNIFYPDYAHRIQERKIRNILATGADMVALGNSGCALQIASGLKAKGRSDIRCFHTVELIDRSWRQ
jgi:glycolate oxidase iron-sulfur subunit